MAEQNTIIFCNYNPDRWLSCARLTLRMRKTIFLTLDLGRSLFQRVYSKFKEFLLRLASPVIRIEYAAQQF